MVAVHALLGEPEVASSMLWPLLCHNTRRGIALVIISFTMVTMFMRIKMPGYLY